MTAASTEEGKDNEDVAAISPDRIPEITEYWTINQIKKPMKSLIRAKQKIAHNKSTTEASTIEAPD